jgi:hypothetical protein
MHRILAAAAVAVSAAPAGADVTATYVNARGIETVVEVNDAGFARMGTTRREEGDGSPDYSIFRPDGDYAVLFDHGDMEGYNVVRWDVFKQVIENSVNEGLGPIKPLTPQEQARAARAVPAPKSVGGVLLEGRPGTMYLGEGDEGWQSHHWVVISSDPKLKPLASAFARFFRSRSNFYQYPTQEPDVRLHELWSLMTKGAPLELGDLQLRSVKFDKIDDGRFRLPSTPLSPEQYQAIVGYVRVGVPENSRIQRPPQP